MARAAGAGPPRPRDTRLHGRAVAPIQVGHLPTSRKARPFAWVVASLLQIIGKGAES